MIHRESYVLPPVVQTDCKSHSFSVKLVCKTFLMVIIRSVLLLYPSVRIGLVVIEKSFSREIFRFLFFCSIS